MADKMVEKRGWTRRWQNRSWQLFTVSEAVRGVQLIELGRTTISFDRFDFFFFFPA